MRLFSRADFWRVTLPLAGESDSQARRGPPADGDDEQDRGNFIVQSSHQVAHYSGDHVTTFVIITKPQQQWLRGWSIKVRPRENGGGVQVGAVHCWILDVEMGEFTKGFTRRHLGLR